MRKNHPHILFRECPNGPVPRLDSLSDIYGFTNRIQKVVGVVTIIATSIKMDLVVIRAISRRRHHHRGIILRSGMIMVAIPQIGTLVMASTIHHHHPLVTEDLLHLLETIVTILECLVETLMTIE